MVPIMGKHSSSSTCPKSLNDIININPQKINVNLPSIQINLDEVPEVSNDEVLEVAENITVNKVIATQYEYSVFRCHHVEVFLGHFMRRLSPRRLRTPTLVKVVHARLDRNRYFCGDVILTLCQS